MATIPLGFAAIYLATWKLKAKWRKLGEKPLTLRFRFVRHGNRPDHVWILGSSLSQEHLGYFGGLVFVGAFISWETRAKFPVINLDLFSKNRTFALSSLAALINYSATFAVTFMLSLYLQYIKGMTSHASGLVLMAQPLVMAAFSPIAGKLSDRIEPRRIASLGMALTAAGLFAMSLLETDTGIAFIVADLALLGFGFALFSSPNMNAIMSSVDKRFYGIASGTVGSVRLLGLCSAWGSPR